MTSGPPQGVVEARAIGLQTRGVGLFGQRRTLLVFSWRHVVAVGERLDIDGAVVRVHRRTGPVAVELIEESAVTATTSRFSKNPWDLSG
jgi:hypothetical protein